MSLLAGGLFFVFEVSDDCDQSGDYTEQDEQGSEGKQEKGLMDHAIRIDRAPNQVESHNTCGCEN